MLKQNWRLISRIERLGDILLIVLAFFIAYYGRRSLIFWNDIFNLHLPFEGDELAPLKDYFIVLVVALAGYMLSLSTLGAYSSMRLSSSFHLFRVSLLSSVFVFVTLAATLFILKIDLSRSFIGLFCVLVCLSLATERFVVLRILRFWRRQGRNFRNVIVCGVGEQAVRVAREILGMPELGLNIRAFAQLRETSSLKESGNSQHGIEEFRRALQEEGIGRTGKIIVGTLAIMKALEEYSIDEVIFTDVVEVMPQVEEMMVACSEQGVRTTIVADLFSIGLVKSGLSYFGDIPLIHFQTPPGDRWELAVKRGVDVFVASCFMLLLWPLFILVGLAVKFSSKGPIFYIQKRVGLNGRLFNFYKFRSMYVNADKLKTELNLKNEMLGPVFKMANDPRVTSVGKLLRRFSLDELPQLWNVLVGDMSLVGPRPPIPGEVSLYDRKSRRRLSMRPGLTCTWQVSGRNKIKDFESWVKLDLEYIDNWSLGRDLRLLVKTIPAVIFGTGR